MIKYFLFGIIATFIISCQNNKLKTGSENYNYEYTKDSVDSNGNKIVIYGSDSIYYFKIDTLYRIEYLDSTNRIKFKEYNKENLYYSEYRPELTGGLTLEYYYMTGDIYRQQYEKDTIIITAGNPLNAFELNIEYYENGNINHKGYMTNIKGQTTAIGNWYYYSEDGVLFKIEEYVYPQQYMSHSEENVFYYRVERIFYPKGELKSKKIYKEFLDYGSDSSLVGSWEYYDENGNLIKKEEYSHLNEKTWENQSL